MPHPPAIACHTGQLALALLPLLLLAPPAAANAPGCASYEACMDQAFTTQWNAYAGLIANAAAGLRKDRALLARAQATGAAALIEAAQQRVAAAERRWEYARGLAAAILDPDYEKHLQARLARTRANSQRAAQRLTRERELLEGYLRVFGPAREAVEREIRAEEQERRRAIQETALSAASLALAGAEQVGLPVLEQMLDKSKRDAVQAALDASTQVAGTANNARDAAKAAAQTYDTLKAGMQAAAQVKDAAMRGWEVAEAGVKTRDALEHDERWFAAIHSAGAAGGLIMSSLKLSVTDPAAADKLFGAGTVAKVAAAGRLTVYGQALLVSLNLAQLSQTAWMLEDARGRRIDLELREQAMLHRVKRARVQQASAERLQQAAQAQLDRRARIAALMQQAQDLQ